MRNYDIYLIIQLKHFNIHGSQRHKFYLLIKVQIERFCQKIMISEKYPHWAP